MLTLNGEAFAPRKNIAAKMIYVGVLGLNQQLSTGFLLKTSEKIELGKPTISGNIVPEISITGFLILKLESIVIIYWEEKLKFKAQISIPISSPKEYEPTVNNITGRYKIIIFVERIA